MRTKELQIDVAYALNDIAINVHEANKKWWLDLSKPFYCESCRGFGEGNLGNICRVCRGREFEKLNRNVGELLMLVVSELSEALEGHRKNLMDDKLPHRKMFEVEIADALIRLFDIGGGLGLDLGGAFVEKMAYNAKREDHKIEARLAEGGKKY